MKMIRRPRALAALVALALAMSLAACGDDDDSADAPATTTAPADSDAAGGDDEGAGDEGAGDEGEVFEVEMIDFGFVGLPERASVGDRITVVNKSAGELHEIVVFRLPDGEDRSIEELLALPEEEAEALFQGMPEMVLIAAPGGPQIDAVGDGTLTQTGRFVVICSIPTGADPEEFFAAMEAGGEGPPEVDGGPPHFVHGMVGELIVE